MCWKMIVLRPPNTQPATGISGLKCWPNPERDYSARLSGVRQGLIRRERGPATWRERGCPSGILIGVNRLRRWPAGRKCVVLWHFSRGIKRLRTGLFRRKRAVSIGVWLMPLLLMVEREMWRILFIPGECKSISCVFKKNENNFSHWTFPLLFGWMNRTVHIESNNSVHICNFYLLRRVIDTAYTELFFDGTEFMKKFLNAGQCFKLNRNKVTNEPFERSIWTREQTRWEKRLFLQLFRFGT